MPVFSMISTVATAGLRPVLRRAGWAGVFGVTLIVATLAAGALADRYVGDARSELARERARLLRPQHADAAAPTESDRMRLERFYARRFPGESELAGRLSRLYAAAVMHGIAIQRVDYRIAAEPGTPLRRVALALPVQGDFPRIHAWLGEVLTDLPELALEGLSIKRDGSEANRVEAELRLALFVGVGR